MSDFDEGEHVSPEELAGLVNADEDTNYLTVKLYRVWVPEKILGVTTYHRQLRYLSKILEVPGGIQITPVTVTIGETGWGMVHKPPVVVAASTVRKQAAIIVMDRDTEELLNFKLYREDGELQLRVVREDGKYKLKSFYLGL